MRILLLHDDIYVPSLGGGVKVVRCLLEHLATRGHACLAIAHALTRSIDGPQTLPQFQVEMHRREISLAFPELGVARYRHRGVEIDALLDETSVASRSYVQRRIKSWDPDWIVVTEDKRSILLNVAMKFKPHRVVLLLQTVTNLPFGPLTVRPSESQTALMRMARSVIVISGYLKGYLDLHAGLAAHLIPLPVFGNGPFPQLGRHDQGCVTMINPCDIKGMSIFMSLAQSLPGTAFAAVPTWGASDTVMRNLSSLDNIRVLAPADNVGEIFRHVRVLVVPSLWPETFGLVVPEAMLRGIPVLASNVGGLPEAKLGVDYVLPVHPAEWRGGDWHCPSQDTTVWLAALTRVLDDRNHYESLSRQSRAAAAQYISQIDVGRIERLFEQLADEEQVTRPRRAADLTNASA